MFDIKVKNKKAEIFIYEDIGESWLGGLSAKRFNDELNAIGKMDTINVRINSDGGSVFDGVAIQNSLRKNSARVEVDIDGIAASIASIIAMAGDEIRIADNGFMMIHDPWIVAGGGADDLRKTADLLVKVRDTLVDTYVRRTGVDADTVSELMAAETWMDSTEAKELGFVDTVTGELAMAAHIDIKKFKNPPQALIEPAAQPKSHRPASSAAQLKREKIFAVHSAKVARIKSASRLKKPLTKNQR